MKKFLFIFPLLLIGFTAYGQTFQERKGFSFQGYARDFDGAALGSQQIVVRFSIFPSGGSNEYQEEQTVETDAYGLFSAVIGSVSPNTFADLEFGNKNYFLKVETRANGSDFAVVSETELLAVPYAKNASSANVALLNGVPVGTVLAYAGASAPAGFFICNGSNFNTTQYPQLASVLSTRWGGSGVLPDLRNQFIRGSGPGRNVGTFQDDAVGTHKHTAGTLETTTDGDHWHREGAHVEFGTGSALTDQGSRNTGSDPGGKRFRTSTDGAHKHTLVGETGNNVSAGTETRPANYAVLYIIKHD